MGIAKKTGKNDAQKRIDMAISALKACKLLPRGCNRFVQHDPQYRELVRSVIEKYGRLYADD